ncbi:hypothetical protein JNK13_01185 [bacterium]|nr:hypothetical protein [bacterium]
MSSRLLPRMISMLLIITWVPTFVIGTNRLVERHNRQHNSIFSALTNGKKLFGVRVKNDEDSCVGIIESTFMEDEISTWELDGVLNVSAFNRSHTADINFAASFDVSHQLTHAEAKIKWGTLTITARNDGIHDYLELAMKNSGLEKTFKLPFPQPLRLEEVAGNQYKLTFPRDFQTYLNTRSLLPGLEMFVLRRDHQIYCNAIDAPEQENLKLESAFPELVGKAL